MDLNQIARLESLRDRLLEVALRDADPSNWTAADTATKDMTREQRGDAAWCRRIAVQTVALTMQVQRLMLNPVAGGAAVPETPGVPPLEESETMEAEIARYETAAAEVLSRAARGGARRDKP